MIDEIDSYIDCEPETSCVAPDEKNSNVSSGSLKDNNQSALAQQPNGEMGAAIDQLREDDRRETPSLPKSSFMNTRFNDFDERDMLESTRRKSARFEPETFTTTDTRREYTISYTSRHYQNPSPANQMPLPDQSVDSWIDNLQPNQAGSRTVNDKISLAEQTCLSLSLNSKMWAEHHLPPVQISPFDGSAINWPNFIELFYENVHSRLDDDGQRMVRLSSYLSGSAKRRVEGLGTAGSHYILVLKELKRRYGQSVFIARAVLDRVVTGKRISPLSADRLLNFSLRPLRDWLGI
uniref:uncharacterized protein LOC120332466 n=1 Tax=Styela clava TaxID=7725 RepID=UPI00193964DF|nr:uncharacterized protein LOC120332466 [Styela clava]